MKEKNRPFSEQDIIDFMRDLTMESGRRFTPGGVLTEDDAAKEVKSNPKVPQTENINDPLELL